MFIWEQIIAGFIFKSSGLLRRCLKNFQTSSNQTSNEVGVDLLKALEWALHWPLICDEWMAYIKYTSIEERTWSNVWSLYLTTIPLYRSCTNSFLNWYTVYPEYDVYGHQVFKWCNARKGSACKNFEFAARSKSILRYSRFCSLHTLCPPRFVWGFCSSDLASQRCWPYDVTCTNNWVVNNFHANVSN